MKIIYAILFLLSLGLLSCTQQNKVVFDQTAQIQFKCVEGDIKVLDEMEVNILGEGWMSKEQYIEAIFSLVGSIEFAENSYEDISKHFHSACHLK